MKNALNRMTKILKTIDNSELSFYPAFEDFANKFAFVYGRSRVDESLKNRFQDSFKSACFSACKYNGANAEEIKKAFNLK